MQMYERTGRKYLPEEIFSKLGDRVNLDGDLIKLWSSRFYCFQKSLTCATCGITGQFFIKERQVIRHKNDSNTYHMNLYAVDADGNEVLMTKDHIIPRSFGGGDGPDNLQTMCSPCNGAKGGANTEYKRHDHSTPCPSCKSDQVILLKSNAKNTRSFYICFDCQYIEDIGVGVVGIPTTRRR